MALFESIHEVQEKVAMVSTVLNLTSIDPNTAARVNSSLEGSSKTVKKLEALVVSIKDLENELKEAQYDYYYNVAELLSGVKNQMSNFDIHGAVPHVILIRSKLSAIERELQNHIQWSCREIGPLVTDDPTDSAEATSEESSIDLQSLSQLYLVIDVLGVPFRKDLLERFAQLQLIQYEKRFKAGSKNAGISHLDARYAWFKRLLKAADDRVSSIFPSSWNLPYYLFVEFSRRTSKHVADALEYAEKNQTDAKAHVTSIMKGLRSIQTFEAEMKAALAMQIRNIQSVSPEDEPVEQGDFIAPVSITEVFDSYLGPYVQQKRQKLETLMEGLIREEEISARAEAANSTSSVAEFESSSRMFQFIKDSLRECMGYSTGSTYLSLSKEFRICLQHYAENLKFRCPSPATYKEKKPQYVISPAEEKLMSRIVTTGKYCIDTVPQLELEMKNHINPKLREEIDFSVQIDAFMDMVGYTYGIIAMGISERLEPAMKTLKNTNVTSLDSVGDDSKYVKEIRSILNETVPRIRLGMAPAYFQGFCMKLVTTVLEKLLENIWHLKRISKTGGGQLLLDLQGVKTYLLRMPNTNLQEGQEPLVVSKAYNSLVNSQSFLIERVLKLVCSEDAMMKQNFQILWPEGTTADLESVMALRGSGGDPFKLIEQGIISSTTTVTQGGKFLKSTVSNVAGGLGSLTGKMMFDDHSTHSQGVSDDGHGHVRQKHDMTGGAGHAASKALGDMKSALGSFNVFGTNPTPPSKSSTQNAKRN